MKGGETATRGGKVGKGVVLKEAREFLCVGDGEAFQQLRKGRIEGHPLGERKKRLEEGERRGG